MDQPFIGSIVLFAGNFAPRGWALCNGQLLAISTNTALFSILGTTYGGNGTTTFALPDFRGRAPVHQGQGPGLSNYVLGESIGTENITLLINNMPAHSHTLNANTGGNLASPTNNFPGNEGNPIKIYAAASNTTMNPQAIGAAGGSQPFSIIQPVLCVSFIIALQGIFPSRN